MKGGIPTPTSIGISATKSATKNAFNASTEVAKQTKQMVSECYRQCAQKAKDTATGLTTQGSDFTKKTINNAASAALKTTDDYTNRVKNTIDNKTLGNKTLGGKKRRSTRNIKKSRKYKRTSNNKRIQKRRKMTRRR